MSTNKTAAWNENTKNVEERKASGTNTLSGTLHTDAVVDNGNGTVTLTTDAAHGYIADSWVVIDGTTNYDGMHKIILVPTTSGITITSTYTAETPAGTETVKIGIKPNCAFQLFEFNIHLDAASATSENLTLDADAEAGSAYDYEFESQDMNALQDHNYFPARPRHFMDGDAVIATWDNTNSKTWGVDWKYRRIR